jgi:hypothetical protein
VTTPQLQTYKVKPRALRRFLIDCFMAKLVPMVTASPGVGKSAILGQVAKEINYAKIDERLSTCDPTDLKGLPTFDAKGRAYFAPFTQTYPVVGMSLPTVPIYNEAGEVEKTHQFDGWVLFFDEINSATKAVQAAAYKVILDGMIGQFHLHPQVLMAAAGNLMTDRAVVNAMSTALQTRLVHLELEPNQEEWLADVAFPKKFDPRIIGYIGQFSDQLLDFKPDHKDRTFACPRTWEFLNNLLQSYSKRGEVLTDDHTPLIAGIVGSASALKFVQYTKVWADLVTVDQVVADPVTLPLPSGPQATEITWATITMLMQAADTTNFGAFTRYVNRLTDTSMKLLFYRLCLVQKKELRDHPDFAQGAALISKYLTPDWSVTSAMVKKARP